MVQVATETSAEALQVCAVTALATRLAVTPPAATRANTARATTRRRGLRIINCLSASLLTPMRDDHHQHRFTSAATRIYTRSGRGTPSRPRPPAGIARRPRDEGVLDEVEGAPARGHSSVTSTATFGFGSGYSASSSGPYLA